MYEVLLAIRTHIPALGTFLLKAWEEAGPAALGWTGATDETIREIASALFLEQLLTRGDSAVLVAVEGEEVVGFAVTRRMNDGNLELAGIIVLESRTGQGIGSALMTRAKEAAREAGFPRMVVRTESVNERAIAFYRRHGYEVVDVRKEGVRGREVDMAVLHLELSDD